MKDEKTIKIKELKIEVETELHTDMQYIKDIKIPKGWRLLTLAEWIHLYNNYRDKINWFRKEPDEIVSQPIKENEAEYPFWNVWFGHPGAGSGLYGYVRYLIGGRAFGVRFCRDLKEIKK